MPKVNRVLPEDDASAMLARRFANELYDELANGRLSFQQGYDLVTNLAAHLAIWSNDPRNVGLSLGASIQAGIEHHLARVGGTSDVAGSA